MGRLALEVADLLRDHGPAWREANRSHVSLEQLKVRSAIERCRTAALGGHVARCENTACGHTEIAYNSCVMGRLSIGELHSTMERFFKLIRWQQEIDGPHDVFERQPVLYWRVSPKTGYHIVGTRQREWIGRSPAGIEWEEGDQRDFSELLKKRRGEGTQRS